MTKQEIEDIKELYQANRTDFVNEKIRYRIDKIKEIFNMLREIENIESEMERLGLTENFSLDSHTKKHGFKYQVRQFKKMYITMILRKTNWNQTKVATILKLERSYLALLIKQLGIKDKNDVKSENTLSCNEVAKITDLSKPAIYRYVETKKLPHIRVGRNIRFLREAINNWMKSDEYKSIQKKKNAKRRG